MLFIPPLKIFQGKFNSEDYFRNIFAGNSRAMRLLWYGRCSFTCISSTPQIGTIAVQCPPFSSYMVLFLQRFIQSSDLRLVLRCTMWSCVFSAYLECTSIIYTHKTCMLSGLQSCMWPLFLLGVYVGLVIMFSAKRYPVGRLTLKVMPCGIYSWALIPTLQTLSWCFAGLNSEDGLLRLFILWGFCPMWRLKNQKPNETWK